MPEPDTERLPLSITLAFCAGGLAVLFAFLLLSVSGNSSEDDLVRAGAAVGAGLCVLGGCCVFGLLALASSILRR